VCWRRRGGVRRLRGAAGSQPCALRKGLEGAGAVVAARPCATERDAAFVPRVGDKKTVCVWVPRAGGRGVAEVVGRADAML